MSPLTAEQKIKSKLLIMNLIDHAKLVCNAASLFRKKIIFPKLSGAILNNDLSATSQLSLKAASSQSSSAQLTSTSAHCVGACTFWGTICGTGTTTCCPCASVPLVLVPTVPWAYPICAPCTGTPAFVFVA